MASIKIAMTAIPAHATIAAMATTEGSETATTTAAATGIRAIGSTTIAATVGTAATGMMTSVMDRTTAAGTRNTGNNPAPLSALPPPK